MFAHAVWIGTTVADFVDGLYCGAIKVAYDFNAKRAIPFSEVEKDMRLAIIAEYSVTQKELAENGGDALKWATYPGNGKWRRSSFEFEVRQKNRR